MPPQIHSAMSEPIITFDKVNKWYGNSFHVLRDIDLQVAKGERIVVCGPSGSGKSTLIRCINRLEEHQEGRLIVDGVEHVIPATLGSPAAPLSAEQAAAKRDLARDLSAPGCDPRLFDDPLAYFTEPA